MATTQISAGLANPIIKDVTSKAVVRQNTKTELEGVHRRAKFDINNAEKELDEAKEIHDKKKNYAVEWKDTAEDACQKKRAVHNEIMESRKKWFSCPIPRSWRDLNMKSSL